MSAPLEFREVYDENFEFVWRTLRRLGIQEADLQDASQDVFLVVHRKLAEFEGRSKITTWLFTIAMRVAKDRRAVSSVRRLVADENAVLAQIDDAQDAFSQVDRRERAAILDGILDGMALEQRAVFVLFELEDMTSNEIAAALDVPLGTVYSRLRLARETFTRAIHRLNAKERFEVAHVVGGSR
jgi:RNA polymerase sigma-70 factor, ECF subfamily